MNDKQGPIIDFVRLIWELLREALAWIKGEWQSAVTSLADLRSDFRWFAIAVVVAVVVIPLVHAFITRPKRN